MKSLANALKFRTSCYTSASDPDSEQKKLRLGVEVYDLLSALFPLRMILVIV